MSSDTTLGSLIEAGAERDAIHIAVAPVQAGEDLAPGSHVGFLPHSHAAHVVGICDRTIGIVDPFLKEWVREGQWFYMCLYPRTITSLRHNWSHPDFPCVAPPVPVEVEDDGIDLHAMANSKAWLKAYVSQHCPYYDDQDAGYESFLNNVRHDRTIYYYGSDCHSLGDVEDADELFSNLSVVLGQSITASYFNSFTCSC